MLSEYLLWAGIAALIVLICLLVRWWNRWERKRSLERKRKLEEASDLRWEKIQRAEQKRVEEIQEHIQSLLIRLQEIHRRARQREAQRQMPRKAREARRRVPTRNRYPVAAGVKARNEKDERDWKESLKDRPSRRLIATFGNYRLTRIGK